MNPVDRSLYIFIRFCLSNGRYIDYLSFTYATSEVKNIKLYTINTTFKKRENIKDFNTIIQLTQYF